MAPRNARQYVLGADVIGVDETIWWLMEKKPTTQWWAWAMDFENAVYCGIGPSRSAKAAHDFVGDFDGTIGCDGYQAYETLARQQSKFRLAPCRAHARRHFVEPEPNYPVAAEAVRLIGELFAIDRDTDNPANFEGDSKLAALEARPRARSERAPPILEQLREWALNQRALPRSGLRKAIDDSLARRMALQVFGEDPMVPLDNNASERALGLVIGRKNGHSSRFERSTKVAAIMYTVMETAKLNGVAPHPWIVDAVWRRQLDPSAVPLPLA